MAAPGLLAPSMLFLRAGPVQSALSEHHQTVRSSYNGFRMLQAQPHCIRRFLARRTRLFGGSWDCFILDVVREGTFALGRLNFG